MKVFLVGGAVRDELLGRPVKDRDYVVVGSTPDEMVALGYDKVGADFPVFLHPSTREEYALARTERKTGVGYNGFTTEFNPSITLEDDLRRRDLTINSMARDLDSGELIDPFRGKIDLENKVLRHTSEAFVEDPLRVLRVARFAARYGYSVATETLALMRSLVERDEMEHLTTERVWLELEKALMETQPVRFVSTLWAVGAWQRLFPEITCGPAIHTLRHAANRGLSFDERVGALMSETYLPKAENVLYRFKAPAEIVRLVRNVWMARQSFQFYSLDADMLALLKSVDAFRRPDGFKQIINVLRCIGVGSTFKVFINNVQKAFNATSGVTFASLSPDEQALKGAAVGEAIDNMRAKILAQLTLNS